MGVSDHGVPYLVVLVPYMCDVIIVGAGAAGLSAARILSDGGCNVVILEARDRPGGRMLSAEVPGLPVAIELGAEFVHGRPAETWDLIREAGLHAREMTGDRWCSGHGKLKPCERDPEFEELSSRLDDYRGPDLSAQDFVDRFAADLSAEARTSFSEYLQGFDAADPARVSVHWLQQSGRAAEQDEGDCLYRIDEGYSALIWHMRAVLPSKSVDLCLSSPVDRIEWSPGQVRAHCGTAAWEAARLITTVPVSVLPSIAFHPPIQPAGEAAYAIVTGPVVRITFVFRERFWATLAEGLKTATMIHSRDPDFPAWWS
ncbi:MAG: FAD-dependent oxidoreductase, partial [Bryobacteraceae bacterium]|nr:FAD-dependent oxidoreductase [Bryobacteraceae bacterium]